MSAFKPGDICVGQNLVRNVEANGMECTVVGVLGCVKLVTKDGVVEGPHMAYYCHWADGTKGGQFEFELRLKRPPNNPEEKPTEYDGNKPCEREFFQDLMKRVKQREAS